MRSAKRLIADRLKAWVAASPDDATFAIRFERMNRRWQRPYHLSYDTDLGCFIVDSDGVSLAIPRRSRLHLVKNGVERRREDLHEEYLLGQVPLGPGDVVVDVGANVGEVSMLVADRYGATPVAFEPDPREFRALAHNLSTRGGHARAALLWSHEADIPFHSANETGDSSAFDPPVPSTVSTMRSVTLDAELRDIGFDDRSIALLKLEAEGAEPEVLRGAAETLRRTTYVSADVGPERGVDQESTLVPVLTMLQHADFTPIAFHPGRQTMLFARDV